jgi:hypothetical protein
MFWAAATTVLRAFGLMTIARDDVRRAGSREVFLGFGITAGGGRWLPQFRLGAFVGGWRTAATGFNTSIPCRVGPRFTLISRQ